MEGSEDDSTRGGFTRRRGSFRGSAEMHVDDLLAMTLSQQRLLLADRRLRQYMMWSFHQEEFLDAPFSGVDTTCTELRRRLGLGQFVASAAKVLYWAHRLRPNQIAHRPTAFDAADNPYFRPGGRTRPLDGAGDGMPEVVHDPVSGDQLVEPITQAQ